MGWDAYATKNDKAIKVNWGLKSPRISNKVLREEFENASKRVIDMAGGVDWLLGLGGLDVSNCAYEIEYATGENAWDEYGWCPKKVKGLCENANWKSKDECGDDYWAVLSAKEFLEVCAKNNLGIEFSW